MRFLVSVAFLFVAIMCANLIGAHFELEGWKQSVLAGTFAALSVFGQRPIFKAWDRWRATHQASKE